jgi:putative PIN family toxin of toxin-antitoxin system
MPKAVVDANVFVSAVLGGRISSEILRALTEGRLTFLYSPTLLQEVEYVLSREKFGLDSRDINQLVNFIRAKGEFVLPTQNVSDCRDPKDNPILECALAGRADCIITGDKDLLLLHPFHGIPILTPRQFLQKKQ